MGGMKSSPPKPKPPPPPPPPVPMPDPENELAKRRKQRDIATQLQQSGRYSTILTDDLSPNGRETLG